MENKPATLVDAIKAGIDKAKANRKAPTPAKWVTAGRIIRVVGWTVAIVSYLTPYKFLMPISALLGEIGNELTKFATTK